MKKAVSLITAAALAAGTFGMMAADAAPIDDGRFAYARENKPIVYFDVDENDVHTALSDNFIFINKSKISEEEDDVIFVAVYISDQTKKLSELVIKLIEDTGNIKMRNGYDPVELYGATPFKNYCTPGKYTTYKPPFGHPNGMNMTYQGGGFGYFALSGENTDSYPAGCFDMSVAKDVPSGTYYVTHDRPEYNPNIELITSPTSNVFRVITDENDHYIRSDLISLAYQSPDIQINISDRDLGDANDNGQIENMDAELLLFNYVRAENMGGFSNDVYTAGDVNGDRVVDDIDAEIIMDYDLLYGSEEQPEVSFVDYVKERISEEE